MPFDYNRQYDFNRPHHGEIENMPTYNQSDEVEQFLYGSVEIPADTVSRISDEIDDGVWLQLLKVRGKVGLETLSKIYSVGKPETITIDDTEYALHEGSVSTQADPFGEHTHFVMRVKVSELPDDSPDNEKQQELEHLEDMHVSKSVVRGLMREAYLLGHEHRLKRSLDGIHKRTASMRFDRFLETEYPEFAEDE